MADSGFSLLIDGIMLLGRPCPSWLSLYQSNAHVDSTMSEFKRYHATYMRLGWQGGQRPGARSAAEWKRSLGSCMYS